MCVCVRERERKDVGWTCPFFLSLSLAFRLIESCWRENRPLKRKHKALLLCYNKPVRGRQTTPGGVHALPASTGTHGHKSHKRTHARIYLRAYAESHQPPPPRAIVAVVCVFVYVCARGRSLSRHVKIPEALAKLPASPHKSNSTRWCLCLSVRPSPCTSALHKAGPSSP